MNEIDATEITERDNLAVVGIIEKLEPIQGKDRVELVSIQGIGYTFVCEKIHNVGDMVVWIKYDTIVPDNELFAFMKDSKFRVKPKSFTHKDETGDVIGKTYSQGLVLPLDKVRDWILNESGINMHLFEDQDLTEILGIKKYIQVIAGSGTSLGVMSRKGDFPTHLCSKTDETNGASKKSVVDEIQGMNIYISLKQEGSSLTVAWDDTRDELMVCSRNNIIGYHETNKFWQAVNKNNLEEKIRNNKHLIIQAECVGPGIQKNKLGLTEADIRVFNIIDKTDGNRTRMGYYDMCECARKLELPLADIMCEIKSFDWDFDKLQEYADIMKYPNGETAEGIVVRPFTPCFSRALKSDLSFKIINRNYTL